MKAELPVEANADAAVAQEGRDAGTVLSAEDKAAMEPCATRWQMRELTGQAKHLDKAVFDSACVARFKAINTECAKRSESEQFRCRQELSRGVFDQIEEAAKREDVVLDKFLGTEPKK